MEPDHNLCQFHRYKDKYQNSLSSNTAMLAIILDVIFLLYPLKILIHFINLNFFVFTF